MGPDPDARPPVVVVHRAMWRGVIAGLLLLGMAAVIGAPIAALNALDTHQALDGLGEQLDDQRAQNERLRQQLDCRYVLSADRDRIESEIFVTVALALSAARRRDTVAVGLYAAHLDWLSGRLDEANDRRERAIEICDIEPENVLG